jgi:histidine phosphotransferase ChpT
LTIDHAQLASLLCSRLCHDLVSPVGAISNGIELLADEQDETMRARCTDLLADSARVAAAKLGFFRLAFGASAGLGEQVDAGEARTVLEALFSGDGKVDVEWMIDEPSIDKAALKVLLNLALIGGDALVRGGTLAIAAERHGGGSDIVVRAEGVRILLPSETAKALEGSLEPEAQAPRTAPALLARSLVDEAGGQIQVADTGEGVLMLGARLPARS